MRFKLSQHWYTKHRALVLERDGRVCHYCGKALPLKSSACLDHVVPRSKGGSDDPDNLVVACKRCNTQKGNSDLGVYIARRLAHIDRERKRLLELAECLPED